MSFEFFVLSFEFPPARPGPEFSILNFQFLITGAGEQLRFLARGTGARAGGSSEFGILNSELSARGGGRGSWETLPAFEGDPRRGGGSAGMS